MQRKRNSFLAGLVAIAVLVGGVWSYREWGPRGPAVVTLPASGVMMTAGRADLAGVDPSTSFQLASAVPLTAEAVKQRLTVAPALEFSVEQVDTERKLFAVKPVAALDANRVYSFRLASGDGVERPYQWSFQTKAEFRVLGSLPRHQSSGVPLDTGIELNFTHENYGDVNSLFSIAPAVAGRFERHKKTISFVPRQPLQPGTVYTVTLKPGLTLEGSETKIESEYRFSFETMAVEESGGKPKSYLYVGQQIQEFPVAEIPYFEVQYYNQSGSNRAMVGVSVFRYRDSNQFIDALKTADKTPWWAEYSTSKLREGTSGLNRVARFDSELKQMPGHYTPYLFFPEALPAGYYLAELTVDDQIRQMRFQVTDLATYLTVTSTKSLIWVNDAATKGPVSGAEVTHPGGKVATGADGLTQFDTPSTFGAEETSSLYLQVRAGGKESVVSVRGGSYTFYPSMPRASVMMDRGIMPYPYPGPMQGSGLMGYWKYLYLDRPLYKPDDSVKVFGIVQPREVGATPLGQVTAAIVRREYRWMGFGLEQPPLARVVLPVADGAFTGTVLLPNLKPGHYELQIKSGQDHVVSNWFEVQAYTKPAYSISVSSDARAIFTGQTVNFKTVAAFFEGTPVPNLALNYSIGWANGRQGVLTTGADGTAAVPFTPGLMDDNNYYGGSSHAGFHLWASLPEVGEISTHVGVQVFTRNVTMQPAVDVEQGWATIKAQVNHITLDKINSGTDSYDFIGPVASGMQVRGTLIEQNWVRVEEGEYYDFIAKKVVKQYRYQHNPIEVGSFTVTTDSEGKILHRMSVNPEKSYQVRLAVNDTNGRTVMQEWGFSGTQYKYEDRGDYGMYKNYNLMPIDPEKQAWSIGEEVILRLAENEATIADRPSGFLFYQARMGLQAFAVQNTATYRFNFKQSDAPNTAVKAVYFNGRQYKEAYEYGVRFDAAKRELKVSVTSDRSIYRPGETVGLTIQVTDQAGNPVRAHVNLNLVDEALFALSDQTADILATLYGEHVPSGILQTRQTHFSMTANDMSMQRSAASAPPPGAAPAPMPGAAKLGMGGESAAAAVRRDFRDASYFGTVSTDANGRATTSVKLPDNLTTWRMTYQAFSPGTVGAATGTAPVVVKIPFFVDSVFSDIYLTGDRPVIAVRGFGADLADGATVNFDITVMGPASESQSTASGRAFTPVSIPIGTLAAGTYTVQIRGTAPGGLTDTLEKRFTVIDSYLKQTKVDFHLLSPQTVLSGPATGPVSLLFTDHLRGRYLQMLTQMRWWGGSRLEQRLAQAVAVELLQTYFGPDDHYSDLPEWNAHSFQTPEGSIAILPYSDGDLYLSALVADLAADRFDRLGMAEYFYLVLDDPTVDRDRGITALYGLAALRQPVLQQVRALLTAKDLTVSEQLRLAMATVALGDLEGARPVYRALMQKHAQQLGATTRFNAGRDSDEIVGATAQAAILAAALGEPEAAALLGYVMENPAKEVLLLLEQLLIARAALPMIPNEPASFTYVDNGETKEIELQAGQAIYWTVTAEQLTSMKFTPKQGQVGMTVSYEAPLSASELRQAPGYQVTRSYSVEGQSAGTAWRQGDLVKVTLSYQIAGTAPGGGFELTDYLPSGLRMVERPWQYGMERHHGQMGPSYPMSVNGQKISFWAWEQGREIHYYARVVSPGQYTAEQPVLQHQQSGTIYSHGSRTQVRIDL